MSLLLLLSSVPGEAVAACSLSWDNYKRCYSSPSDCEYPNSFEYCKTTFYTEGKSRIPAKYTTTAGQNAFLSKYTEARMTNQPDPTRWADQQMTQAKKEYQQKQQGTSSYNTALNDMYAKSEMTARADETLKNSNVNNARRDVQWYEQGLSKQKQADLESIKQKKVQTDNEANTAAWNKFRKDNAKGDSQLVPVRWVARTGMHSEYAYVPVNANAPGKTGANTATIVTSHPNDPLYLDEMHIIYRGKPAIASMKAIGRDLLDLRSTTRRPTPATVAQAGEILLAILQCSENPSAVLAAVGTKNTKQLAGCSEYNYDVVEKLGLVGALLVVGIILVACIILYACSTAGAH